MSDNQIIISIAGPSTSGKSTLANLFKPLGYKEIVSTTTRPPRTGEINGIHYHFVDEETFFKMENNNELVEYSPVGKYFYGVSKSAIKDLQNSGESAVLVLEPKGANRVAEFCQNENIKNHKVFINNPLELLIERLYQRKAEDKKATDEVYKEREHNIRVIEPLEWTEKAYNGEHYYDNIFDTFNSENQLEVFDTILNDVQKKVQNTIKRKP